MLSLPFTGTFNIIPARVIIIEKEQPYKPKEIVKKPKEGTKEYKAEIILRIAEINDIRGDDILAMWHLESLTGDALIGDQGCSRGNFHINLCANPDAKNVIGDIEKEAQWVADKLNGYGYRDGYETLAIAKYNLPSNPNWKYAEKVDQRKKYIKKYID